ncbi:MAG: hypothetical protein K6G12_11280 [Lachnospiraceae bacterium]|nr:hypothetical protein [Lachnospiraceae bacterium]
MKRSKKRRIRRSSIGYIIIIAVLLMAVALLVYERFYPVKKLPVGTWIREEDMTGQTSDEIAKWLASAKQGSTVMSETTYDKVSVDIVLRIAEDGTYEQYVDEQSYTDAGKVAYNNLAKAFGKLAGTSFEAVGMSDESEFSAEELEALMIEAVGMSVEEYLRKAVADLMPAYEEYSQEFKSTGSCAVEGDLLCFDNGKSRTLLYDKNRLVLDDAVYIKVEDVR